MPDYPGCPVTVDLAVARGVRLRPVRWGIPDVLVSLLGYVLLALATGFAADGLGLPVPVALLATLFVPWLALAGWPLLTTALQGNGPRIDLGLRLTWADAGWGVLGGIAALIIGVVLALGLQAIFGDFTSAAGDVADELRARGSWPAVIAFALAVGIGAPVAEELAFRGLGWAALAKRGLPAGWNLAVTAVVFSMFHLEPIRLPILLTTGLILGLLRWRTRSLGASVVAHMVNNLPGAAFFLWG